MSIAKMLKMKEYNTKTVYHDNVEASDMSDENFFLQNRS